MFFLENTNVSSPSDEYNFVETIYEYNSASRDVIIESIMTESQGILNEDNAVSKAWEALKNFFKKVWQMTKNLFTKIKNFFGKFFNRTKKVEKKAKEVAKSAGKVGPSMKSRLYPDGKTWIQQPNTLTSKLIGLGRSMNFITTSGNRFGKVTRDAVDSGIDQINTYAKGIKEISEKTETKTVQIDGVILDAAGSALGKMSNVLEKSVKPYLNDIKKLSDLAAKGEKMVNKKIGGGNPGPDVKMQAEQTKLFQKAVQAGNTAAVTGEKLVSQYVSEVVKATNALTKAK